jgi:hypothetical protein
LTLSVPVEGPALEQQAVAPPNRQVEEAMPLFVPERYFLRFLR